MKELFVDYVILHEMYDRDEVNFKIVKYNNVNELLNDVLPEVTESIKEDREWRKQKAQQYTDNGFDETSAISKSWDDYWKMAKERDGVEFSIHKLNNNSPL